MELRERWGPALTFIVPLLTPLGAPHPCPKVSVSMQLRLFHRVLRALC